MSFIADLEESFEDLAAMRPLSERERDIAQAFSLNGWEHGGKYLVDEFESEAAKEMVRELFPQAL
jgi:hypothetical protein